VLAEVLMESGAEAVDATVTFTVAGMLQVGALEAFAGAVVTAQERLMIPVNPLDGLA
jgi:hypothetical protein